MTLNPTPPSPASSDAAAAAPAALFDGQIIATIKMVMLMCTMLVFVPTGLLVSSFLMPPHRRCVVRSCPPICLAAVLLYSRQDWRTCETGLRMK